jgi:hypothetical protein
MLICIYIITPVSKSFKKKFNVELKDLTIIAWFIIFFTIYLIITFILALLDGYIIDFFNYNTFLNSLDFNSYMGDGNTNAANTSGQSTSSSSRLPHYTGRPTDGVIAVAGLTAGLKLAQAQPTIAGKIAVVAAGIAVGCGARATIITKNISGNISADIGKNFLINYDTIADILGIELSGNNLLDLLSVIQYYHSLSLFLLFLIVYYLILLNINTTNIETKIKEYLYDRIAN